MTRRTASNRHRPRDRWVLPIAFGLSGALHAALLLMPLRDGVPAESMQRMHSVGVGPSPIRLLRIETGPDAAVPLPGVDPVPEPVTPDRDAQLPITDLEPAALSAPGRRGAPSAANADPRLWGRTAVPRETSSAPARAAQARVDSAVAGMPETAIRIGRFQIPVQSCPTLRTCRIRFQANSDLGERFTRFLEVEDQAALQELYRKRLEAMKIRRRKRNRP